jgi:hypothetical protein
MKKDIRPLLVLGTPRSGTTLIGNYVGSSPSVCNLGEYGGFFLSYHIALKEYRGVPAPYKDSYIRELQEHAKSFAYKTALESGNFFYCDSTPWNLLVARTLASELPTATFILMLRHYSGVIQSLERSYRDGFQWATGTWAERASLWCDFYENTRYLPPNRTIPVSYDGLCSNPHSTVKALEDALVKVGLEVDKLDRTQFAKSHATNREHCRPTIGAGRNTGGVTLASISSVDLKSWNRPLMQAVFPIVKSTDRLLRDLFRGTYVTPPGFSDKSLLQ